MDTKKHVRRRGVNSSLGVLLVIVCAAGGGSYVVASSGGAPRATSERATSVSHHGVTPVPHNIVATALARDFSIFRRSASGSVRESVTTLSRYPKLQQEFQDLMQPSDPSYLLGLDFGAAALELTSEGPELLVPGANGACALLQVPQGASAGQFAATAVCNTLANIESFGGLSAGYQDPATNYAVDYGMTSNQVAYAQLDGGTGKTTAIAANGYAVSISSASRVVFKTKDGAVVKEEPVYPSGRS